MTNYTKWMIGLVVLMLVITGLVVWTIQKQFFEPESFTIHEAAMKIETLYGGTVVSFEQKNDIFFMTLERQNEIYDLEIDPKTGEVTNLTTVTVNNADTPTIKTKAQIQSLLKSSDRVTIHSISLQQGETPLYIAKLTEDSTLKTVKVDAITGETISTDVQEQNNTPKIITKQMAKEIALSQLSGTVNYNIFEESSDGGYYLIKISTSTKASIFQIHAISGKVISITHHQIHDDDEEDDDDSDEDDFDEDEDD